jgi:transposase
MYTINIVLEALSLYNNNLSFRKTSKILQLKYKYKITRQTIMNWHKWMKNDLDKICKKRMTKKYCNNIILSKQKSFNLNILNDILKIIKIDPFITRNEIKITINKKYNIKLSDNSLSSIFKKLNLTRKKPRQYIVKSIDFLDQLIVKRNNFKLSINKIDINKIISIDESGFNNLNTINKGLSIKGKRINIPCENKKIKNKSLIVAITTTKIINNEIHETGVNGLIFKEFIQNTINKLTELNYCFIFDNVPFHHNKLMLKLIIDSGHKYLFTPSYSPNNNPIETIFGIIKFNFRNDYKNKYNENKNICIMNLIKNAIEKFNKDYNKEMITKIFIHSIKYDYKDLEKELRDRLIIKNQK